MKTAPAHVIRRLRSYDPDLRIRWSQQRGCWAVDRRADKRILSKPVKWLRDDNSGIWYYRILPVDSEKYIQYHQGYSNILYSTFLDERLFKKLFESDAWKNSYRGKSFIDDKEYQEQKAEERKRSKQTETINEIGKEALSFWRWKEKEKVSMYGNSSSNNIN